MQIKRDKYNSIVEYKIDSSLTSQPLAIFTTTSKSPFPVMLKVENIHVCISKQGVKELIQALTNCL